MKTHTLLDERITLTDQRFVALYVIEVVPPVRGSAHQYKYSLVLVVAGECVLRFDNEAGKGDHYHLNGAEHPYCFSGLPALLADFWAQVNEWEAM